MPTPFFADLVRELAQEGGTGPLTPTGAVPGHRRFADAVPPGVSFDYAVAGIARPEQWEVGTGRIGADGRLLRDVVAASSNDGAAVDFTAGLKTIALTVGAGWFAAADTRAATLAADMAAFDGELAGLADALDAKQPLSTTHGSVVAGEATDAVTVRRGAGWINIPLSALAFRGPDGRYMLNGPLGAAAGGAIEIQRPTDGDVLDIGKDGGQRLRVFADGGAIGLFNVAGAGAGRDGLRMLDGAVAFDIAASEVARLDASGLKLNSGQIAAPDGTSAAPTYSFAAAPNMGMRASGANLGLVTSGAIRLLVNASGGTAPGTDNAQTLGTSGLRWSVVYAATGTINTSDTREKTWRGTATEAELRAARRIIGELGFFQWNAAIAVKGEAGARLHFGARAQAVWAIMADEGLIEPIADGAAPSSRYAFLCHDQWDEAAAGEGGSAGDRFGLRTDQLAMFLIAAQGARLAALETMA